MCRACLHLIDHKYYPQLRYILCHTLVVVAKIGLEYRQQEAAAAKDGRQKDAQAGRLEGEAIPAELSCRVSRFCSHNINVEGVVFSCH